MGPVDPEGHKGTFGAVLVVGGNGAGPDDPACMLGGPVLAARAAFRVGAGLVRLAMPGPLVPHALAALPEAMGVALPTDGAGALTRDADRVIRDAPADAVALGPALGPPSIATRGLVREVLKAQGPPLVLDADGLNALADMEHDAPDARRPTVLTPHVGEARRLLRCLPGVEGHGTPLDTEAQRAAAAGALASRFNAVCVLKSHQTDIATPEGNLNVAARPEPVLAVAGSGDVLAGAIAGLAARNGSVDLNDLADAARLAVEAHNAAGALWRETQGGGGDRGLLAHELADLLPAALARMSE